MLVRSAEVRDALDSGRPVVALESTLLAHGLPRPVNLEVGVGLERVVRDAGAVPATVAVLDGAVRVGLTSEQLGRVCEDPAVVKASLRDVAPALAQGVPAGTTVAATAWVASRSGIAAFATGGLGGVHRGAATSFDVSADLDVLASCPLVVVCSGVKSILDVPATVERLETLSVGVLGYRTDRFPGFYVADGGAPVTWRADSPEEVARVALARHDLGLPQALVVARPVPADAELDPTLHDRVLAEALSATAAAGIGGRDLTPHLLAHVHAATGGASLRANVALVRANAELAARVAVAVSAALAAR
ncbi:MAG TPA: pseudouridine-5'-phosphate glycosidase [Jiangellales bacterium]|nr:pseudouridine-5'-phosphate glycosidase [Jiangellales bacterium]